MVQQWNARNKSFIITGGASGLGLKCITMFLSLGAKCIALLDADEEIGRVSAKHLSELRKSKVIFIKCNINKKADIINAFQDLLSQFKQIDVIINIVDNTKSEEPNIWKTNCDVNWEGLVAFTLRGMKYMRKDTGGVGGTIVNILSTGALTQFPFVPVYNGSKTAFLHFSQCISMAPFYENTNVRILTMCFESRDTHLPHNLKTRCYESNLGNNAAGISTVSAVADQKIQSPTLRFVNMDNGWCNLVIN